MANEMNLPVPESRVDQYLYQIVQNTAGGGGGGGGGSELPAVTADDNGDVLTVVNGAWDKAAPSGGGVMFVHFTTEDDGETWTVDKTLAEIYGAMSSDVLVKGVMRWGHEEEGQIVYMYHNLDPYECTEDHAVFSGFDTTRSHNERYGVGYGAEIYIGPGGIETVDVYINSVEMESDE